MMNLISRDDVLKELYEVYEKEEPIGHRAALIKAMNCVREIPFVDIPSKPSADPVNHPPHYEVDGLECSEVMRKVFGDEAFKIFCKLNAFKYIWREGRKNGDEDLAKAEWYLEKYLEIKD